MVCRCSLLKSDDVRLIDQLHSSRTCINCDLYAIEDARHVVLQCAYTQNIRAYMQTNIYANVFNAMKLFEDSPGSVFPWLLGRSIPGCTSEENDLIHCISGCSIYDMYKRVLQRRTGIG